MKGSGAFTLVELLVVVSITALLAGLVYTASFAALNHSRSVQCASNLRQWGVALHLYTIDHDGYLPRRGQGVQPLGQISREDDWFNALPPYLNLPSYSDLVAQGKDPKPGDKSIFSCPSASKENDYPYFLSYGMNMYLSRWDQTDAAQLGQLSEPHTLAFMSDSPGGYASTVPSSAQYSVQARHSGRANVVFVDGHVESFTGDHLGCGSKDKTQPDVRWQTDVTDTWSPNR